MANAKHTNSLQYAKQIYKKYGLRNGLFKGWAITTVRDVPSFGVYFYTYEVCKQYMTGGDKEAENNFTLMMAGGLAGTASWACLYPIDVLKSCVQSQSVECSQSSFQVARQYYQTHGARFFFNGLGATLVRAFPVSAVTFWVYEMCLEYIL